MIGALAGAGTCGGIAKEAIMRRLIKALALPAGLMLAGTAFAQAPGEPAGGAGRVGAPRTAVQNGHFNTGSSTIHSSGTSNGMAPNNAAISAPPPVAVPPVTPRPAVPPRGMAPPH